LSRLLRWTLHSRNGQSLQIDGARTIIITLDTSRKITGVSTFIAFLPITNSNYLLMPDLYPAELAAPSTRLIDVAYAFGSVSLLNAVSWWHVIKGARPSG
jgi:hypothetical protein